MEINFSYKPGSIINNVYPNRIEKSRGRDVFVYRLEDDKRVKIDLYFNFSSIYYNNLLILLFIARNWRKW